MGGGAYASATQTHINPAPLFVCATHPPYLQRGKTRTNTHTGSRLHSTCPRSCRTPWRLVPLATPRGQLQHTCSQRDQHPPPQCDAVDSPYWGVPHTVFMNASSCTIRAKPKSVTLMRRESRSTIRMFY